MHCAHGAELAPVRKLERAEVGGSRSENDLHGGHGRSGGPGLGWVRREVGLQVPEHQPFLAGPVGTGDPVLWVSTRDPEGDLHHQRHRVDAVTDAEGDPAAWLVPHTGVGSEGAVSSREPDRQEMEAADQGLGRRPQLFYHRVRRKDSSLVGMASYTENFTPSEGVTVDSGTPESIRLSDITVDDFYSNGMSFSAADTLELTDVTITGNSSANIGIDLGADDATLTNIEVTGLTTGTGIDIDATGVTLNADNSGTSLIENCQKGIWVRSGSPTIEADTPANDSFDIENCTTGIYVSGSTAAPVVTDVYVEPTDTGIQIVSSGGGTYKDVDIHDGAYGMTVNSSTSLTYREGQIDGWDQAAVYVIDLAGTPDFGTSSSHGENNFIADSSSYVPMKVKGRMWPTPDVSAQYNWWGQSPPPTMTFVDYSNHLTSSSSYSNPDSDIARTPEIKALALGFRPNPMQSSGGVIQLALPKDIGSYKVEIFDVQGRLIRIPEEGVSEFPQLREITWDGNDVKGIKVPSGVYFVRVRTNSETLSVKVVKSR